MKIEYATVPNPEWVQQITANDLLSLVGEYISPVKTAEEKIYTCYLSQAVIYTSNNKNQDYTLLVYGLDWPDVVQSASITEYLLLENQTIDFHRIGVIRNEEYIDKSQDVILRSFDNENSSSSGSILGGKKINCTVVDLRLGDIFVIEYTIRTDFSSKFYLDSQYYRYMFHLPQNNWLYKSFSFRFIQNRDRVINIKKRYFRDDSGEIIPEEIKLKKGEKFDFKIIDFHKTYEPNVFVPFFEITSEASWQQISNELYSLYHPIIEKNEKSELGKILNSITREEDSLPTRIRKVIEYVQNNFVYIFDGDAMHGHIPQDISDTVNKQSGDCKAKSLLLAKLLHTLGVDASLILVNYDSLFYVSIDKPSPFAFNHMIVKIQFEGKNYYVDPTWKNRYGDLEYRTQPLVGYYLEIKREADIQLMIPDKSEMLVQENVDIDVKNGIGKIKVRTIYRQNSADNLRFANRDNSYDRKLEMESQYQFHKLQYQQELPMTEFISDAKYTVISDDKIKNEIVDEFTATLLKPYIVTPKGRVIKYYYQLDTAEIDGPAHKDKIPANVSEINRKLEINIHSNIYYNFFNSLTRREVEINNNYFSFSNKKKLSLKSVKVIASFSPKSYLPFSKEDLSLIKSDYSTINNSNFGTGVVYLTLRTWIYIIIIGIWIIFAILGSVIP